MAVLLLFAAACGDDSVSLADAIDAGNSASDLSGDSGLGGGDDDGGDDDAGGDDAGGYFGAGSNTNFCQFNEEINNGLDDVDFFAGEPDDVSAAFRQIRDNMARAVGLAPSEIRDEVALLSEGIKGLVELLEDYDYDMFAVPEDDPRLAAVNDERYDEAVDRINDFCGFDDEDLDDGNEPPVATATDDQDLPDDEMRAIVIQVLQTAFGWDADLASCVVDELGLDDPSSIDPSVFGDPSGEVCGQSILELLGG